MIDVDAAVAVGGGVSVSFGSSVSVSSVGVYAHGVPQ